MPDGRLRDGKGFSTYPPTVRIRERIANLSPEAQKAHREKSAECSAIWSACKRLSKTEKYKKTTVAHRRAILLQYITKLFETRSKKGKKRHGVDEETIVDKHLRSEAAERKFAQQRNQEANGVCLRGVAVDQDVEEYSEDGEEAKRDDDEPLPFDMTSDTAAGGGQYAQNTYIELRQRRIEQQNIRMEQKIDLIYQLLSNNLPMVQQRANLASMPSAFPFLRSGFMSYPHMHMSNHGEPDGGLPNPSDDFFDEGYASAPLNSPTQQGGYSTSFDLLAREKAAAAQVQQQNYTMPFGFAATQAANAGDKANEDSALSPSDQAHSQV